MSAVFPPWGVKLDGVSVARGGRLLLCGVNFELHAGVALALRGGNGVGKTSLLRVVAGLSLPAAGHIHGAEGQVAYAGHADGIKPALSVGEILRFWCSLYGAQENTLPALEALNLSSLRNRPAGTLSAGQKRRLALARLLVINRPLWVLDEPTAALDTASVALFAQVVEGHLQRGGGVLFSTHMPAGFAAQELDLGTLRPPANRDTGMSGAFDEAFL